MSTFTATLIISFLSLAQNIIDNASRRRPFQFGMFFSIIAIGFHLFAAFAARVGMICFCFRISKSLDIHLATVGTPTVEDHSNVNNLDRLELPIHHSWYDRRLRFSSFPRPLRTTSIDWNSPVFPSALFLVFLHV